MRDFNFQISSDNFETIDKIISGLLPHENYDPDIAADLLKELVTVLPIDEVYGIHYIFYQMFQNMHLISLFRKKYKSVLSREIFQQSLETSIDEVIRADGFHQQQYFREYNEEFNLEVEAEFSSARNIVFSEAINRYNALFEMKMSTGEAMSHIRVLKEALKRELLETSLNIQARAIAEGYRYGRKLYKGTEDAIRLGEVMTQAIKTRFNRLSDTLGSIGHPDTLDSIVAAREYHKEHDIRLEPLFYMGWEPIDGLSPICTTDIVCFVANEGVGKTRCAVYIAYRALMESVNICYICGETPKAEITAMLEAAHIFAVTGYQFKVTEIMDRTKIDCPPEKMEELNMAIDAALVDLYENPKYGKATYIQNVEYEEVPEAVRSTVFSDGTRVIIIDHVAALGVSTNIKDHTFGESNARINYLFRMEEILIKELGIAFINTAHTSNTAAERVDAGKDVGVRIGGVAAAISKYSTIQFLLRQSKSQKAQDQVVAELLKSRRLPPLSNPLLLSRCGYGQIHQYKAELQYMLTGGPQLTEEELMFDLELTQ